MTKDELWEKYAIYADLNYDQLRAKFNDALAEYGAIVRDQDVKTCKEEYVDAAATAAEEDFAYNSACDHCAAAIENTPLP